LLCITADRRFLLATAAEAEMEMLVRRNRAGGGGGGGDQRRSMVNCAAAAITCSATREA